MRLSLLCATIVAGPMSVVFLAATAAAQLPGGVAPPRAAAPSVAAPAPSASGTSVAVIDVAYIFKNHVRFNGQMNDMKQQIEGFDAAMRDETQKIQKKAEALQSFNPSSTEFKKADEELAHLKSDLQIKVQAKRREFLEAEAKVYYNIYREVEEQVALFAQRNGIRLVLRYTADEMKPEDRTSVLAGVNKPVVYQSQLDITQAILNQVNAGATMPPSSVGAAPPVQTAQQPQPRGPIVPVPPGGATPQGGIRR